MIDVSVEAYDNLEWKEIRKENAKEMIDLLNGAKVLEIQLMNPMRECAKDDEFGGIEITVKLNDGRIYILATSSDFSTTDNTERFFVEIAQLIL